MLASVPDHPQRIVYLGTPELAVPPLEALVGAGHEVALVVSRADKRRGRGSGLHPSPVKAAALDLELPVTDRLEDAVGVDADLGVVVAYGRLIPTAVLERLPMVNLHFSLLPRWRGAAPVERAILAGDECTGVCLMAVEEGLDTGGIYARAEVAIEQDETLGELRARLVAIGSELLVRAMADGFGAPTPQVGEGTYAHKIAASELHLDWTRQAEELARVIRLGNAWTTLRSRRLKVWGASIEPDRNDLEPGELDGTSVGTGGDAALILREVQPEGKGRVDARAWLNGARRAPGDRLGE